MARVIQEVVTEAVRVSDYLTLLIQCTRIRVLKPQNLGEQEVRERLAKRSLFGKNITLTSVDSGVELYLGYVALHSLVLGLPTSK